MRVGCGRPLAGVLSGATVYTRSALVLVGARAGEAVPGKAGAMAVGAWVLHTYRDMKNDICLRGRRQISRYTAIFACEYDYCAKFVRYIAIFALKFT